MCVNEAKWAAFLGGCHGARGVVDPVHVPAAAPVMVTFFGNRVSADVT